MFTTRPIEPIPTSKPWPWGHEFHNFGLGSLLILTTKFIKMSCKKNYIQKIPSIHWIYTLFRYISLQREYSDSFLLFAIRINWNVVYHVLVDSNKDQVYVFLSLSH